MVVSPASSFVIEFVFAFADVFGIDGSAILGFGFGGGGGGTCGFGAIDGFYQKHKVGKNSFEGVLRYKYNCYKQAYKAYMLSIYHYIRWRCRHCNRYRHFCVYNRISERQKTGWNRF